MVGASPFDTVIQRRTAMTSVVPEEFLGGAIVAAVL
jgi:hypothetical protein